MGLKKSEQSRKKYRWLKNIGNRCAVAIVPILYNSYMWVVYRTSRKTFHDVPALWERTDRGENLLAAVWHQDAFISPFCHRGHDILAMVSQSSMGNILSEILRKCHFIPVRGGSSKGGRGALAEVVEYLNTHTGVVCGMAVDGSRGPARRAKKGMLLIAQATGIPIYPMRSWAKWKILAPSWDKMLIPLPFNHLAFFLGEPLVVPEDVNADTVEQLRQELERRLNDLALQSEIFFPKSSVTYL
jgi:hypothetical protein